MSLSTHQHFLRLNPWVIFLKQGNNPLKLHALLTHFKTFDLRDFIFRNFAKGCLLVNLTSIRTSHKEILRTSLIGRNHHFHYADITNVNTVYVIIFAFLIIFHFIFYCFCNCPFFKFLTQDIRKDHDHFVDLSKEKKLWNSWK